MRTWLPVIFFILLTMISCSKQEMKFYKMKSIPPQGIDIESKKLIRLKPKYNRVIGTYTYNESGGPSGYYHSGRKKFLSYQTMILPDLMRFIDGTKNYRILALSPDYTRYIYFKAYDNSDDYFNHRMYDDSDGDYYYADDAKGITRGPFKNVRLAMFFTNSQDWLITTFDDSQAYIIENGMVSNGPYAAVQEIYPGNGKSSWVALVRDYQNKYTVIVKGKKIMEDIGSYDHFQITPQTDKWIFHFKKDGQNFIACSVDNKVIISDPISTNQYSGISQVFQNPFSGKYFYLGYKSLSSYRGESYLVTDKATMGPLNYINSLHFINAENWYASVRKENQEFLIVNGREYGPVESQIQVIVNPKNNDYFFYFEGKIYLNNEVWLENVAGLQSVYFSSDPAKWRLVCKKTANAIAVIDQDREEVGPFSSVLRESTGFYSFNNAKSNDIFLLGVNKKGSFIDESYLIAGNKSYGPYEKVMDYGVLDDNGWWAEVKSERGYLIENGEFPEFESQNYNIYFPLDMKYEDNVKYRYSYWHSDSPDFNYSYLMDRSKSIYTIFDTKDKSRFVIKDRTGKKYGPFHQIPENSRFNIEFYDKGNKWCAAVNYKNQNYIMDSDYNMYGPFQSIRDFNNAGKSGDYQSWRNESSRQLQNETQLLMQQAEFRDKNPRIVIESGGDEYIFSGNETVLGPFNKVLGCFINPYTRDWFYVYTVNSMLRVMIENRKLLEIPELYSRDIKSVTMDYIDRKGNFVLNFNNGARSVINGTAIIEMEAPINTRYYTVGKKLVAIWDYHAPSSERTYIGDESWTVHTTWTWTDSL